MAKIIKKYAFSKAEISKDDDGKYIISEIGKDEIIDYDFTTVLDSFIGLSGISISIGVDDEMPKINE